MATDAAFLIPPSLHVEALRFEDGRVTIRAVSEATAVRCPVCGDPTDRVHSRYARMLADLPWAGVAVRLRVQVRKFFCANPACPARSSPNGWRGSPPEPAGPIVSGNP